MTEDAVDQILRSWALGQYLVKRLWVFGSRARGTERPDSDLDVAVEIFHQDESDGLATWMFETEGWLSQFEALLPFKVDLQQYQGQAGTPHIDSALKQSSRIVVDNISPPKTST